MVEYYWDKSEIIQRGANALRFLSGSIDFSNKLDSLWKTQNPASFQKQGSNNLSMTSPFKQGSNWLLTD